MQALVLVRKGVPQQAFEMQQLPAPNVSQGQILITAEAFGLNFADVMARQGLYREAPPMPCVIGYEVVGEVTEVGSGVDSTLIGKRVAAFTRFGGYGKMVVTDARAVVPIGNMDAGIALALTVQYCTAIHCIEKINLIQGVSVLVHAAAGGVGTALTQLAKNKGAIIFGTVGSDEKAELAVTNGVDHVINYRTCDYVAAINKRTTNNEKLYATFNAVGGSTFKKDRALLGHGGTIVCFGAANRSGKSGGIFANLGLLFSMGFIHPLFLMMKSQSIVGVNMLQVADHYPALLQRYMQQAVEMEKQGEIKPHVGASFEVSQIAEAHELLESRKSTGKIVVKW